MGTAHILTPKTLKGPKTISTWLQTLNLFASMPYFGCLENYQEMVVVKFCWDLPINGPPKKGSTVPSDKNECKITIGPVSILMSIYWRETPLTVGWFGATNAQQGSPLHGAESEADLPLWLDGGEICGQPGGWYSYLIQIDDRY